MPNRMCRNTRALSTFEREEAKLLGFSELYNFCSLKDYVICRELALLPTLESYIPSHFRYQDHDDINHTKHQLSSLIESDHDMTYL